MFVPVLLAISDTMQIGMWTFNTLISVALAVGLFLLGRSERARCRKEEQQAAMFQQMQDKLDSAAVDGKTLTEKLIEERLRAASHEVVGHVQSFVSGLDELRAKATEAAEDFKALHEADHDNEMTIAVQIESLKRWMSEGFASKGDVQRIDQSVRAVEQKVAVLSDRKDTAARSRG